jgi:hypothetical protein
VTQTGSGKTFTMEGYNYESGGVEAKDRGTTRPRAVLMVKDADQLGVHRHRHTHTHTRVRAPRERGTLIHDLLWE